VSLGILSASLLAAAALAGGDPTLVADTQGLVTSYPAAFFAAAQPTTALDMIQRLPGFTLDTGVGQNGVLARGFGGAAGNVLIDGVRPPDKGDTLDQILLRIPASSVERIELIRAGAPGVDMHGKTVLANVVRRKDFKGKATLTLSGTRGDNGQMSGKILLEGERRVGQMDLQGSVFIARMLDNGAGDGTWDRVFADGTRVDAAAFNHAYELNYKATGSLETPAWGGKLKIDASVLIDPYRWFQNDIIRPAGEDNEVLNLQTNTAEVGVRYEHPLGARASLETYVLQQLNKVSTSDVFTSDPFTADLTGDAVNADFELHRTGGESIVRETLKAQLTRTLTIQAGLEGDYNWLKTHTTFAENGEPIPLPAADVVVKELRGEAYANAVWQALPSLSVEGGFKFEASHISSSGDVISARSLHYPKPRLVVAWTPDKSDQIRLRVEREIGQLNFDDFAAKSAGLNTGTVFAGNPTLNPEQDWVFEASFDHRFWRGGDATITLRHYKYDQIEDRIGVLDPSGIVYDAPGNIGAGTEDEAVFSLSLPTDRLGLKNGQLTGLTTFRRSHVIDPTTGQARSLSGLHPNDWELHFNQGLPKLKSAWGFDVQGAFSQTFYRFNEIDTDKLRTQAVAFYEYKPRPDLTLKFEVINTTDAGVEHSRLVYNGPRNADPLAFADVRQQHPGRFYRVSLVKNFG
jgi:outer membrane receptor protein involved in Fe transport